MLSTQIYEKVFMYFIYLFIFCLQKDTEYSSQTLCVYMCRFYNLSVYMFIIFLTSGKITRSDFREIPEFGFKARFA